MEDTCLLPSACLDRERQFLHNFIADYKNSEYLWDVQNKNYYNPDKKKSAYDRLLVVYTFLKPKATVDKM